MEKSQRSYPQMPNLQMDMNTANGTPPPPSYEQAITGVTVTDFPPVRVLPTPNVDNFIGNSAQHHPQGMQAPVGGASGPYVGFAVGGGSGSGVGGPMPGNQQRSYPTQSTQRVHQPMMQQPVVIIQQQGVLPLGPDPAYILCPSCHVQGMTRITHEPNAKTHLMAALLCILGFWCCACLPYCADSCMNSNHFCGNCNKFLGTYSDSL